GVSVVLYSFPTRRSSDLAANLKVVEIMRRGDLHRTRALFGIGVSIGDDRDAPPNDGQDGELADQILITLIVRVHRNAGIAEHRLGPRRCDGDKASLLALDRIAEVPHMALHLALLDLKVGDGGMEFRIPVDE